ncbi:MAG: hypothetical protein PHN74_00535 [Candidatus Pacebacteria bacterium]|nr:hypothetical protein [Candidatus Paceibacterota bacterium]
MIENILDFLMPHITGIGNSAADIFNAFWWILIPFGMLFWWLEFWAWGTGLMWKKAIKWVLLEVKVPKDILKTPKAMENIFTSLHALYGSDPNWEEKFFRGKSLFWLSAEMVSFGGGGIHFYFRVPAANRNLIENALYAEYPDAEVSIVDDYINLVPDVLPNEVFDIWGNDFVLAKDSAYPIRTYEFF